MNAGSEKMSCVEFQAQLSELIASGEEPLPILT